MIKFEDYRNDKNFKIDSLTYQEIFESLKDGISKAVCKFEKVESLDDLILPDTSGAISMKYGRDKDLYPSINMEFRVFAGKHIQGKYYNVILNPFEIEIHKVYCGEVKVFSCEELTNSLFDMMNEKFPNSDYKEKREKYLKNAELIQRKQEELLFL
ncbi:MAG: hypothetical protein J6Q13_02100 [Clostridia bacterium]|nr:hypothetical protein [Clostridia bacterium]